MRMRILVPPLMSLALAAAATTGLAGADKAADVLSRARASIGGGRLDSLDTLSVEATLRRNVGAARMTSEVEILLDLPDRYLRSDTPTGGMMVGTMTLGFNGNVPVRPANAASLAGGALVIRMGPGGPLPAGPKLSPEEQARADLQMLRGARAEISRLMLGWFANAHPSLNAHYTYAGEAEAPDGKAHVIDVTNEDGFSARLFVDQQTSLPLMLTYRGPQPRVITREIREPGASGRRQGQAGQRGEPSQEERDRARSHDEKELKAFEEQPPEMADFSLYFEDWRNVDGIRFPYVVRRAMNGATNEEWTITRVRVNPKIDPKKFEG